MCDVMRTVGGAHLSYDASSAMYIYNMASTVFVRYRGTAVCMCDVMRTVGGAHPSYDASSAIYIYIYNMASTVFVRY